MTKVHTDRDARSEIIAAVEGSGFVISDADVREAADKLHRLHGSWDLSTLDASVFWGVVAPLAQETQE